MGHGIVAGELDDALVPGEPAVHGQRERLEPAFPSEPGEDGGRRPALVVAPLAAHVVEGGAVADLHLEHGVEPRRPGAGLEQGQVGAGLEPDQVTDQRIRGLGAVEIDESHRLLGPPRHPDRRALGGAGGVERRQRPVDRRLAARLELPEELARPVDVGGENRRKRLDLDAGELRRIGELGREDAVDEDEPHPVDIVEGRLLVRGQHRRRRGRQPGQPARVGELPVLVAPDRRAALGEPPGRARPRRPRPTGFAARLGPGREQRLRAVELRCRDRPQASRVAVNRHVVSVVSRAAPQAITIASTTLRTNGARPSGPEVRSFR